MRTNVVVEITMDYENDIELWHVADTYEHVKYYIKKIEWAYQSIKHYTRRSKPAMIFPITGEPPQQGQALRDIYYFHPKDVSLTKMGEIISINELFVERCLPKSKNAMSQFRSFPVSQDTGYITGVWNELGVDFIGVYFDKLKGVK